MRTLFRPCIDLHAGAVKQIVGGSLSDADPARLQTNFVAACVLVLGLLGRSGACLGILAVVLTLTGLTLCKTTTASRRRTMRGCTGTTACAARTSSCSAAGTTAPPARPSPRGPVRC
jgi:hypothetical protein